MGCPVSCCTCGDSIGLVDIYETFTYSEGDLVSTRLVAIRTEEELDALERSRAESTDGETIVEVERLCRIYDAEQAKALRDLLSEELQRREEGS